MKNNGLSLKLIPLVLLVTFFMMLLSCKKKEDDNQSNDQQEVIPSTTKVINKADFQNALISIDTSTFTIILSKDILSKTDLNVGDVIVSDNGDGILRKITSISATSNNLTIETDFASITDAITTCDIAFNDILPPSQLVKSEKIINGIVDRTNYLKNTDNQDFHLTIDFIIFDLDKNPATKDDQIKFTGDFTMDPTVNFQGKIQNGEVKFLKAEFDFDETLTLTATSTLLAQIQLDTVIWRYKFPKKIIMIGSVPLIYQPIIDIHAGVVLNSNCTSSVGFTQGYQMTTGLIYENSNWTSYKTSNNTFEWILPTLSNSISVQPYLRPKLSVTFYGTISPYLQGKGYADLIANLSSTPWWELYLGYSIDLGVKMKIWKKTIFDVNQTLIEDRWKVAEASSNNQPPNSPVNQTPENNATNVSPSTQLSWTCTDPDKDPLTYDIYFGTLSNPQLFSQNLTKTSLTLSGLSANTMFYWKIVAKDNHGNATTGDIWNFTTADQGSNTKPTVTTAQITNKTQTSATSGGEVTSDGGTTVTARGICWGQTINPTIADNLVSGGAGTGPFICEITGLSPSSTYHVRAYATNNVGTAYGEDISFTTEAGTSGEPCPGLPTVSYGGQVYHTVLIGSQCWLQGNLNIGTRINGNQNQENNSTIEKYCYDNLESNCDVYGGLYQWDEAMQYSTMGGVQGICPSGWHIPTDAEWITLADFLGGATVAGGKLKEVGFVHWKSPNTNATNESGFTALPAGFRDKTGVFLTIKTDGKWMSSTQTSATHDKVRYLYYNNQDITTQSDFKTHGFSCRCIKD